ncbi:MAG TPA: carbohydrate ABC transporter permease [Gaiellaceae bacterium]|nr:carbohydrate ABC transporter permease [Gaiellaceae bacterium]
MTSTPVTTGTAQPAVPPAPVVVPEAGRPWWRPEKPVRTGVYVLLLLGCTVIFVYPFLWAVSASLKPRQEVFDNKLIPKHWHLVNYVDVFRGVPGTAYVAPFGRWFLNSAYISLAGAVTVTVSSAIVAFAFAYFRFPLRNALFGLVLASMMLPAAVTMIPVYLIWNHLHLTGTTYPLWMSNLFGSAIYIFLMRQFFMGIPRELFEAARIDGDSYFSMFRRIALPLAKPALIVVFVFEFKAKWTDLLGPLIYLRTDHQFTLARGLYTLLGIYGPSAGGHGDYQVVMAGFVLTTLPLIVIFFLGQRYFVEGIATQGRKG